MRTLSARILLGFAALTIVFGVITVTVVVNMTDVESEVHVIGTGYLPLALTSKDLARRQEDLRQYLESGFQEESTPRVAQFNVNRAILQRNQALAATANIFDSLSAVPDYHRKNIAETRPRLETLKSEVKATTALYAAMLKAPPVGPRADEATDPNHQAALDALKQLRIAELHISNLTRDFSDAFERSARFTMHNLEVNEHGLGQRTIYFGITAVVLGVLIMIWVVITLRPLRRLRDAARRVAAGDYGSSIVERGPAEVADLAREFNSMGRAVEERERELVRSERLAAVGMMAAMITHEVRNPLSSIGLNTELLEDELGALPRGEEARALCRAITHEVDRLTAITEEYLAFARLPKPKLVAEPVNPMVGALASFVREDLATRGVKLVVEPSPEDPVALVDPAQLRQCLVNLVRNAADAVVAAGGGTVTLRTRTLTREPVRVSDPGDSQTLGHSTVERVAIEVADDGVGIPPDVLPRLFDPFFSTKESGNGLGLALTRQIIKDHGGELRVDSKLGHGATFTVALPRAPRGATSVDAAVASADSPREHGGAADAT